MKRLFLWASIGLPLILATAAANELPNAQIVTNETSQTFGNQLKLLQNEVSETKEEWLIALREFQDLQKNLDDAEATKTKEEYWRKKVFNASVASSQKHAMYLRKFDENAAKAVELAQQNPRSEIAMEAMSWAHPALRFNPDQIKKVIGLVREYHLQSPKIRVLVGSIGHVGYFDLPDDDAIEVLTAVAEKNTDRVVKAEALWGLAGRYRAKAKPFGQPVPADTTEWQEKLEVTLERVARKFGDVKHFRNRTFGDNAKGALFELRNLVVGKSAPEIEGEDLDGVRFKLSDCRGRVVVLSFWGSWCGPCKAIFPHEQSLVDRMKAKPFTLIGVDNDSDREQGRKVATAAKLTWRSFWDGTVGDESEGAGSIATAWNVRGWPTIYVLDHLGVIRIVEGEVLLREHRLDEVIDSLVEQAENANRK